MKKHWLLLCGAVFIFFTGSVGAWAQSTVDGAVGGNVFDAQGAVVAGATVTVHNNGSNADQKATTDGSGYYRVVRLDPGDYTVTVDASGFTTYKAEHVVVEVGRLTEVEPRLAIGSATQTVSVSAESPVLNTNSADFSANINQTSIDNLPINGRRWTSFVLLTPGAALTNQFGLISFRGISNVMNNNTVDGVDDNQAFFSVERGYTRIGYSTTQAAIREFQANTSNYTAQYGGAAGGVVNAVTKSGTNELHGSAFWYYRDNDFGATNPFFKLGVFNAATGTVTQEPLKPKDKRHQWGLTLGGPLKKDKLFFFYAYDQQQRNFPGVATAQPTFFNITDATQNICTKGVSAENCMLARGLTQTQINAGVEYLNTLTGIVPRVGDQIINFPKLDWTINDRNTATVEYNRMRWDSPGGVQTNPVVNRGIASFGNDFVKIDTVNAKEDFFISTALSNEGRYQHTREFDYETPQNPAPGEPLTGPGGFPPSVAVNDGGIIFGKPTYLSRPDYPLETENEFSDTLTWVHGNHVVNTGMDYKHVNDYANFLNAGGGSYNFANIADFITEYTRSQGGTTAGCDATRDNKPGTFPCYQNYQQGFGTPGFSLNTNDIAVYVQDDWKATPFLTVNMGLRYELEVLPSAQIANPLVPQSATLPTDKRDFGPRVGFAWDPFKTGKTSVRGGYGFYFGRVLNGTIYQAIASTGTSASQFLYTLNPVNNGALNPNALVYPQTISTTVNNSLPPSVDFFAPNFRVPTIQQGDLAIQREVGWNTVVSVSYLMSLGRQLPNFVDTNIAPATKTITYTVNGGNYNGQTFTLPLYSARVNPAFVSMTEIVSNINSNYNALVLQAEHRLTNGVQFQTSYTFSKALDYGQNQTSGADTNDPFDPFTVAYDYGKSVTNIPQHFVGSLVWEPTVTTTNRLLRVAANGWLVSPIYTEESGLPYSYGVNGTDTKVQTVPGASGSLNGSGGANYLPLAGRNTLEQPRIEDVDMRVSRSMLFAQKYRLEALTEAFNLFNRENFTSVNTTAYSVSGTVLNAVGNFTVPNTAGNTIYRERQIQFALRFEF